MVERISSLDRGYITGDLSVYPEALDDYENLYQPTNNAETTLRQTLTYNAKNVIVEDTSAFAETGIIRVGPPAGESGTAELIYYGKKTNMVFSDLIRGFAGSRQSQWNAGKAVTGAVFAEEHNSIKDAVLNIQATLGVKNNPDPTSVNGILKDLENKFLAPKPLFRVYPLKGSPPLSVRFQNFSDGSVIRYLWDFGDGTTSIDKNPTHVYTTEGIYTVKLNIITSLGAQGVAVKNNYITVSNEEKIPFFYVQLEDESSPAYSIETATEESATPATFKFIDQTDGDIQQRYWLFGDGETSAVNDGNIHVAEHVYQQGGEYLPSLLIIFADQTLRRVFLTESLLVL